MSIPDYKVNDLAHKCAAAVYAALDETFKEGGWKQWPTTWGLDRGCPYIKSALLEFLKEHDIKVDDPKGIYT